MNCDDCREMILDLLYAELAPARKRELEDHLASCPDCAREYKELGLTLSAVRALPDPEVPPFLDARIAAHAKEAAQKSARPRTAWSRLMRPALGLAAVTVITASVAIVMREQGALEPGAPRKTVAETVKLEAAKPANAPGSAPLASLGYLEKDKDRHRELPEAIPPEAQPEGQPAAPAEAAAPETAEPPIAEVTPEEAAAPDNKEAEAKAQEESAAPESGITAPEGGATAPAQPPGLDALALAGISKRAEEAGEGPAKTVPAAPPSVSVAAQSAGSDELQSPKPAARAATGSSAGGAGSEMMKKAPAAKTSAAPRPDAKALLQQAQALEAQKRYREALALYEQALALMGYNKEDTGRRGQAAPSPPAADEARKQPACSPELTTALDGATRLYKKLYKFGDLRSLEQWRRSHCP
ncbi:MAG TPA: zf-HC2 domain-containing protein [bacterium]|nr:zf-HC2 domain-containing protein [bacterium]